MRICKANGLALLVRVVCATRCGATQFVAMQMGTGRWARPPFDIVMIDASARRPTYSFCTKVILPSGSFFQVYIT